MIHWIIFSVIVLAMLILDLGILHRDQHEIKMKEALLWTVIWIAVALLFNLWVYYDQGPDQALRFLTGYVLEKTLSFDNLFVFLLVFSYFKVPHRYQHSILFWGIVGALVMRAVFIAAGIALIHKWAWIIYVFGSILVATGIRLFFEKDKELEVEKNIVVKAFKKIMPVTQSYDGGKFFTRINSKLYATPLFVVLIIIESTDVIFAVDSIPAVLAISMDPFIVYTSNVFAILGLRALYFALAALMKLFHHLHYGLAFILVYVGIKMLVSEFFKIPIGLSLAIIIVTIGFSVVASLIWPKVKGSPEIAD